eukprot:TRINITY_DN4182_c1_g1_i3.p1 TRINITY_DN4182_c1_g1~~TRINITY_DN4182_c1_g1_i3.p1  ORF type:complete len:291 (-),score=68.20 TRINITY_DN4182_c1_g1_i3:103-975(-)
MASAIGAIALASWKLSQFVRKFGWQFSLPQVCLISEMIASILRLIQYLDPYGGYLFSEDDARVLLTLSIPFTLCVTLLISFVWFELQSTDRKLQQTRPTSLASMEKLKIPAIIFSIFIFVVEIVTNTLRRVFPDLQTWLIAISVFFIILIEAVLAVFFIVTGVRLLRILGWKRNILQGGSRNRLRRMTTLMIILGISFVLEVIMVNVWGTVTLRGYSLAINAIAQGFMITFAHIISYAHILMFETPKPEQPSTTESKSSSSEMKAMRESILSIEVKSTTDIPTAVTSGEV